LQKKKEKKKHREKRRNDGVRERGLLRGGFGGRDCRGTIYGKILECTD
jgi:hypothetical protein